ncbi:MAG: Arc family DNA-binding protein [Rhizobiales bacterium]|nr:Arc family DNA-binding protein [Hyphomicrobiales bacterium]
MNANTNRESDKFMLRFPEGMRDRIKVAAQESARSMNAEIIHRLSYSLGFDEDLEGAIMEAASWSGRSPQEEVVHRLKQSFTPGTTLIEELEGEAWRAQRRYDDILKLFIQLTPEERRLLEERAEIAEMTLPRKATSKEIGMFVRLNPIGNRGRFTLKVPKSDYTALFNENRTPKKSPDSENPEN